MSGVTFIESSRGKKLLVLSNFKYYLSRKNENFVTYRCTYRTCTAVVRMSGDEILAELGMHRHGVDETKLNRQIVSATVKRKATEELCERPSKIIRSVLSENLPQSFTKRDRDYVRRNMYNARQKVRPFTKPKTLLQVHDVLDKIKIETSRGELFLLMNDRVSNIVVFSCRTNLDVLADMEALYIDGTFKSCTKFFAQLFTVHGIKSGHYVQLAYALLPSKRTETYETFFDLLLQTCPLTPTLVVVDFETAIHSAVRSAFPDAVIVGCRFHLTQSWFRHVQRVGLQSQYSDKESSVGKWLRYCFGLPFLDPSEVRDGFNELLSVRPEHERLQEFSDYLLNTYISVTATFPPNLWAAMTSSLDHTTNACESFHSRFNSAFYKEHPDIFTFTDRLTEFQIDTYVNIQSLHMPNNIRNAYARKQAYIEGIIEQYRQGSITRLHFIKRAGYYNCPD